MSLIARLGVVLGLNIEEFVKGTDEATKKTREYEYQLRKQIRQTEQAMSAAFSKLTVAATAFSAVLVTTFKAADEISDIAKGFDTSIEGLLATQAALQGAGGNAEDVATLFQKLAVAQDAAREGSDEVRESFTRLGIAGGKVDSLQLGDLFKEVATALANVEDAGQRAALAQDLLGKAVKGVNWADFVDKYKEFKDPELVAAIEENAKAWETIEKSLKEVKLLMMEIAKPFAKLINYSAAFADNMVKAQMAQRNMSFMSGGLGLGDTRGDPFAENRNQQSLDAMMQGYDEDTPIVGFGDQRGYGKKSKSQIAADKKSADEEKRKREAREALQVEIKLIKEKADIADKMFAIDAKGITLGQAAISQEKMLLDLASDLAEIRSTAAKERGKDKAQTDLINAKEAAAVDARVRKFAIDNSLRQQRVQREHQLTMENLTNEQDKQSYINKVEHDATLSLLKLDGDRFAIGENTYELRKLEVEKTNELAKAGLEYTQLLHEIEQSYERSGKTAEEAAERDNKYQNATLAYQEKKQRISETEVARRSVLTQQQTREHSIAIAAIKDESASKEAALILQAANEHELLNLERERFELGSAAYELRKIDIDASQQKKKIELETEEKLKEINKQYDLSGKSVQDIELKEMGIAAALAEQESKIGFIVGVQKLRKEVTEEQLALEEQMFKLDIAQQKGRDIANIQSNLATEKERLGLESNRFLLTQNQYNMTSLLIENANRLAEAEKKYNDQMKNAQYELEKQGGGQRARERYEERIKSIEQVRDIELDAINQVNNARQRNLDREIERQRSFVSGWEYAARRFQEDAENAFNRGAASFQSVMSNMEAAIGKFVETGKFSFEDFAISVVKDLIRIELQAQASYFFRMLLSSFAPTPAATTPANASVMFQTRATGGDIDGPAIVGENGPELFIPSQRGTIIPNTIAPSMAGMQQPQVVYNGPYIENMSAIDTQSAAQFLSKNKMSVWAANKSADRSVPVSR